MFDVGAIVGRMVLDKEKWDRAVVEVKKQTESMSMRMAEFSREMMATGKSLDKLGNKLAIKGAIGLTPLILSFNQAAKSNSEFRGTLNELSDTAKRFNDDLARTMVPFMNQLVNVTRDLVTWFNNLNPQVKQMAVNFIVAVGVASILAGGILKVVGTVQFLVGALGALSASLIALAAANPFIALAIAIGAALAVLIKFRNEILNIKNIFASLKTFSLSGFMGIGAKIGTSIATQMEEVVVVAQRSTNAWQQFFAGMKNGLHDLAKEYADWGQYGADIAKRTAAAMSSAMSDGFFKILTGQFESMREVAVNFGNSLLKMFADILTRIVMYYAIIKPLSSSLGIATSVLGYQDGTDNVPYTGMYRLHQGEKVVPKYDNGGENGKQQLTIYNLITPEAVAQSMSGREGKQVIVNVINSDSLRNGVIRREVGRR